MPDEQKPRLTQEIQKSFTPKVQPLVTTHPKAPPPAPASVQPPPPPPSPSND